MPVNKSTFASSDDISPSIFRMAVCVRYSDVLSPSAAYRPMAVCHAYPLSRFAGSDSLIYSLNGSLFTPYHPVFTFFLLKKFIASEKSNVPDNTLKVIYGYTFLSYQVHYPLEPYTKTPNHIFHKNLYGL